MNKIDYGNELIAIKTIAIENGYHPDMLNNILRKQKLKTYRQKAQSNN